MVDLDGRAGVCKKHLQWNDGSTEDPRLTVHIGDARSYLVESSTAVWWSRRGPDRGGARRPFTYKGSDLVGQKLSLGGVSDASGPAGS